MDRLRSRLTAWLLLTSGIAACSSHHSPAPSGPTPSGQPAAAQLATKAPAQTAPPQKSGKQPEKEQFDVANIDDVTVIGIFPPTTKEEWDQDDGGLSEGYAHLQYGLEDVSKCLAPRTVSQRIKMTSSLNILNGEHSKSLTFGPDWSHQVAIVLVAPGKDPEVIYAANGPSGLLEDGPQAAWQYFGEEHCKTYHPAPTEEGVTSRSKRGAD